MSGVGLKTTNQLVIDQRLILQRLTENFSLVLGNSSGYGDSMILKRKEYI